ncbi:MAG: PAS domain S-box protein [Bacteroidales bacterium]|nr:PAS domain S-box protein [Bacteroidales bacterium]
MADNILIIEKDLQIFKRLEDLLKLMRYDCKMVQSVEEAETVLNQTSFYAVFINLSTISDLYEIERIKEISKPFSIVIVMGNDSQYDLIDKALEYGADDFLFLPFASNAFILRTKTIFNSIQRERRKYTEYLNGLFDLIPAVIIVSDGKGKILNANFAALSKFGKTKEECIGKMIGEFLNCSKANKDRRFCHDNCGFCRMYEYEREALLTGRPTVRTEYAYTRNNDGRLEVKTMRISVAPIDYAGENAVIINMEDISFERNSIQVLTGTLLNLQQSYFDSQDNVKVQKQLADYLQSMNDNLQNERNKLQFLFNYMSSSFLLLRHTSNDEYLITAANNKFLNTFNLTNVHYIGRPLKEIVQDITDKFFSSVNEVLTTGHSVSFNSYSSAYDKWFNINMYRPEMDYVGVVLQDVTESVNSQKRNKELTFQLKRQNKMLDDKIYELRKTKDQLELFLEGSHDGAWSYRYDSGKFYISSQCKKQLGYAVDEISEFSKKEFFELFLPVEEHEKIRSLILEIENGQIDLIEEEVQLKTKTGDVLWVLTRAIVKRDVNGTPIVVGGVNTNITERKINEQLLTNKNSELQKVIDTRNKFISIIAHDLRNPFNAINGLSEMLIKRMQKAEDAKNLEMAKIINQSGKSAYELLNNLLIWARSQQNTIQFSPERLQVNPVVSETISEIKVQADNKHIMLINNCDMADTIWADKQMFQTVVRNIASNAIKFTNENGLVVISSEMSKDSTIIVIEDNGIGMSPETLEKLMVVSKNKSTEGTAGEKGSGMGLLISKEFIDKHHGTVKVESELGMGTKFVITFPDYDPIKFSDN